MATTIKVLVVLLSTLLLGIHAAQWEFEEEDEIRMCQEEYGIDKMIPQKEILIEVFAAFKYDPEVETAFEHFASLEFRTKTDRLESKCEYLNFLDFFRRNSLPLPKISNITEPRLLPVILSEASTMDAFPGVNQYEITGGVHGLVMRIFEKYLSTKDIRHFIQVRSGCDPEFREKINNLRSEESQKLLKNLRRTDEYKEIIEDLEGYSIYIDDYLNTFLDWFEIPHYH